MFCTSTPTKITETNKKKKREEKQQKQTKKKERKKKKKTKTRNENYLLFVNDLCITFLVVNFWLDDDGEDDEEHVESTVLLVISGGLFRRSSLLNEVRGASIDGKMSSLASFSKSTSNEPIVFLRISVDFEFEA